jgi:hypothetical protein
MSAFSIFENIRHISIEFSIDGIYEKLWRKKFRHVWVYKNL